MLQDLEPVFKIVLPLIAIILEFSLSGTRHLRCPAGTAKAGELDVAHMNSWSHGTNYPPLILSGLVDLIHTHWTPLPHGISHFFLSSAFGSSAFLMLSHTKGEPLDGLVHQLLGYCMLAVAVAVLAQGAAGAAWGRRQGQQGYALNAAKSLALIMEGCWFFAITHIMFSPDATWSASHPGDMTRVMFTPVLFTWIFIGVTAFLLLLYLVMHAILVGRHQQRQHSSTGLSGANSNGSCADEDGQEDGTHSDSACGAPVSPGGDSCWDWRGRRPCRYLKVPVGQVPVGQVPGQVPGQVLSRHTVVVRGR